MNRRTNMSDRLDHTARRVERDPHFLASALVGFARLEGLDDEGLAGRLGCRVEALPSPVRAPKLS